MSKDRDNSNYIDTTRSISADRNTLMPNPSQSKYFQVSIKVRSNI